MSLFIIIVCVIIGLITLGIVAYICGAMKAYYKRAMCKPLLNTVVLLTRRDYNGNEIKYTDFIPESLNDDVKHIVFTDEPKRFSITNWDNNRTDESSVISWYNRENGTWYISSRQQGQKVIAPADCYGLFSRLRSLESVDVTMLDVSGVVSMDSMFRDCPRLKTITGMNTWNTSHVEDMYRMFCDCTSLKNVDGLASWDVSNVQTMSWMFSGCSTLQNVEGLTNWNVHSVKSMHGTFESCESLENVGKLRNWDVSNVQNMSYMFYIEDWHWYDVSALEDWGAMLNPILYTKHMFGDQVPAVYLPSWYKARCTGD